VFSQGEEFVSGESLPMYFTLHPLCLRLYDDARGLCFRHNSRHRSQALSAMTTARKWTRLSHNRVISRIYWDAERYWTRDFRLHRLHLHFCCL